VVQEVEYLEHIVSREDLKVDPNKIKAVMDWITPKNLMNLRGFLVFTCYYHIFFNKYGQIATHLTSLLKKEPSHGLKKQHGLFKNLRSRYMELVLTTLNLKTTLVVD
jgi:hypothetical protein